MRLHWLAAAGLSLAAAVAGAKLPPPTPEEQQAAAAKKAKAAEQVEHQKEALARVQDQIAARYRRKHAGPDAVPAAGPTEAGNMPKTLEVPPGQAGPQGGREQSAEAHSTEVK